MLRSKPLQRYLSYDIAIVGGGPVGSAIAYHCAKKHLGYKYTDTYIYIYVYIYLY
jgi:flavin-dependent dehydrogenase